ncbi:MAG: type I DNA topoisomerase [Desulfobacteraceae bacterium]|nr:MAG: type I DNA topoisomerase [Desulfobacteraceae bacterium]
MSKPLVVVESPTKVRTIKKYLGKDYNVVSTVGHIKDLPSKKIGIDIEDGFRPEYVVIPGKQKVILNLKKEAGNSTEIYLAPDPDREGEAIAWHTADILKKKGRNFHRVLFHELTRNAILAAIAAPENLNESKFEAQQARRILDRLVGYQVSPILWKKVKRGLSAGRVQSVALRIICERERAIQSFISEEYWSITAHLETGDKSAFTAKLVKKNGIKIEIPNEEISSKITGELSGAPFIVEKVIKKSTLRNPLPPFITSKLQQDAITKLKFSASKTMMVAQQLYEGIDLGPGEPVGLITYMRTDSTRISRESAEEALKLIRETFGNEYALKEPRFFKNTKKVQDAHEAIRPSSVYYMPEKVAPHLSRDQLALYSLIWKRFVASQMAQAVIDKVTASIFAGPYTFSANGSAVKFPGFMSLYISADEDAEEEKKKMLPDLSDSMALNLNKLEPKQHFTLPPPRFSEASLVKELEEKGIGRPSTYATILSTIRGKGYVNFVKGYFNPSELGFIVNDLLTESFPNIFNVDFTARMEDDLDRIEGMEAKALDVLIRFYDSFRHELDKASEEMLSVKGVGFPTGLNCPECGKELKIKVGKNGHFLACSGYPKCSYSRDYQRDEKGAILPVSKPSIEATDRICDKCQKPMVLRHGKYGDFFACSGYPECRNTLSSNMNGRTSTTGIKCPQSNCSGEIFEKKSKRGKIFFGCSRYPECTYATWDKPLAKECPSCGAKFLLEKTTKKGGSFYYCAATDCGYKENK